MAISINYLTNEILVPKADTVFIDFDPISGRERRELSILNFKNALSDLQDNQDDVWAITAFVSTAPQDLGSFTLGRSLLILAPYFVTFEAGDYSVNLIDGNSNVVTRTTLNGVVPISNNSAGLVQVTSGSGLSITQTDQLRRIWQALMLDPVNPVLTTPTQITFDDVEINLTGDPETAITGARQP